MIQTDLSKSGSATQLLLPPPPLPRLSLIVLQGVPASGKSTLAQKIYSEQQNVRLNRDLLREMLHFSHWSKKNEKDVISVEILLASHFLEQKQSVIIDDTNLSSRTMKLWENLASEFDALFVIMTLDTPVATCIKRDANRTRKVGEEVIMKFQKLKDELDQPNT